LVLGDSSASTASARDDLGTVATAGAGSSTALTTAGDLADAAGGDGPVQAAVHAAPASSAANGDQPMLPHTGPTTSDAVTTGIAGLLALLGLAAAAIRRKVNAA
jgi:LPXTG-motif cell wall-anchored protein